MSNAYGAGLVQDATDAPHFFAISVAWKRKQIAQTFSSPEMSFHNRFGLYITTMSGSVFAKYEFLGGTSRSRGR